MSDNLQKMDKFLEICNLLKLNYEEIGNMNRPITSKEIESVIKNVTAKKMSRPDGFTSEFCLTFKKELTPFLINLFQKLEEDGMLPNSFYEASITLIPNPD